MTKTLINSGTTFQYSFTFPSNEPPGLYWYHPHVHGIAEAAVQGGASGAIIVEGIADIQPAVSGLPERVLIANFGVSDRRFRFKPAGGFGVNRQAVSVQIGTPLRMGFGPDFGEPPLRDTSYLALVCQSKYSCHYYSF